MPTLAQKRSSSLSTMMTIQQNESRYLPRSDLHAEIDSENKKKKHAGFLTRTSAFGITN